MTTQNLYALTDLWNAGGTTFTGIGLSVTDTASASGSLLMDLQVGGSSKFSVTKAGSVSASAGYFDPTGVYGLIPNVGGLFLDVASLFVVRNAASGYGDFFRASSVGISIGPSADTILTRDAANTLAQRNGTNAQAFRVYNTYTDASNYERFSVGFNAGTVQVRQEHAGSGSVRAIYFGNADLGNVFGLAPAGSLLWVTDNTYDIGASGASRPRSIFVGTDINAASQVFGSIGVYTAASSVIYFNTRSKFKSPSDGVIGLYNNAETDFSRLQFGGTTSSFPSLKRSSATLQARLADDSAFAPVQGKITTDTAYTAGDPVTTGYLTLYDSNGTAYKVPAVAA